jgi:hypothetical protein
MDLPDICAECSYVRPPGLPGGLAPRGFLTVVDGPDIRRICTTCGLQLLAKVDTGLKMTMIV